MNKSTKNIFIIVIIVMLFISAISIVYGIMNINKSKASADELDAKYTQLTETALEKCKEASKKFDGSNDYDIAIGFYEENIIKSDTPALKAYVAKSMLSYAISYFSVRNIAAGNEGTENGVVLPYQMLANDLSEIKTQFDNIQ